MPAPHAFDYVVIRVVPRVEREEFVNAGVVLYAPTAAFLGCRIHLDAGRVRALAGAGAEVDVPALERHLEAMRAVCEGRREAGELAGLSVAERFGWVAAPRSTVIQSSPVRTGVSDDPPATLERIFEELVS